MFKFSTFYPKKIIPTQTILIFDDYHIFKASFNDFKLCPFYPKLFKHTFND